MKDQRIIQQSAARGRGAGSLPVAMLLIAALAAGVWAFHYYRPEARLTRASLRLARGVEKSGEESPVALGLAGQRLGQALAPGALLEVEGAGRVAKGRGEIVQLVAQMRGLCAEIRLAQPSAAAVKPGRGRVTVRVKAGYYLRHAWGAAQEGAGAARLEWVKGKDGWLIERAVLSTEEDLRFPGGGL